MTATAQQQPTAAPSGVPHSPMEEWELRIPGTIYLDVLKANRFNQPIPDRLTLGPNRQGMRFLISEDDRKDNQRRVAATEHDPFRNGMLLRVGEDQQANEETASTDVLTDEEQLAIFDLSEDAFKTRVIGLGELPIRQLRALAEGVGASHTKVAFLDDHLRENYMPGGPQLGLERDDKAERL